MFLAFSVLKILDQWTWNEESILPPIWYLERDNRFSGDNSRKFQARTVTTLRSPSQRYRSIKASKRCVIRVRLEASTVSCGYKASNPTRFLVLHDKCFILKSSNAGLSKDISVLVYIYWFNKNYEIRAIFIRVTILSTHNASSFHIINWFFPRYIGHSLGGRQLPDRLQTQDNLKKLMSDGMFLAMLNQVGELAETNMDTKFQMQSTWSSSFMALKSSI